MNRFSFSSRIVLLTCLGVIVSFGTLAQEETHEITAGKVTLFDDGSVEFSEEVEVQFRDEDIQITASSIVVRDDQPWDLADFTFKSGERTFRADEGTFDPELLAFTAEGRVQLIVQPDQ